ncbi:tRNA (adenosine(37)-N6)-threonylcarbamoyltransferase complex ATPase subunit type 1 TsaE [Parasediminibacterium sp. JCM 36343]|uniref:tRNA (adenosine(37)-N6)-threonylcarbamoyltransferase complex ATPase subunit type 1 TsaE n=1 Tax=Parasediminibacterium sp. JCM 36343 TaxID=3374279 RepID=UPI00397BAD2C
METTYTLPEIDTVAKQVWEEGKPYKLWAFHAAMGSGKTTFIHALCSLLQVQDVVSSPTYAIINEYQSPFAGTVYHIDLYRLKHEEEAIAAGVDDAIANAGLCLIEWPEKAPGLFEDGHTFHVYIDLGDQMERHLHTKVFSPQRHEGSK